MILLLRIQQSIHNYTCYQVKQKVDNQQPGVLRCAVYHSFRISSSSPWPPIATFLFIQIPAIALTVQLFLQDHIHLAIVELALQIFINAAMLKVLTTNPGILPQIVYKCETEEQLFALPPKPIQQQHRYLITQRNLLHPQKYCSQCRIYRPIRSIHCSACNHCVQRYDHHCPWLSVCIGKYNYKYFLAYLIGIVLLIIVSLAIGISYTVIISHQQDSLVRDFIVYLLIGILSSIFLLPIARLLLYHFHLIYKGITTNQQIKKTYTIIDNDLPFQKLEYAIHRQKRLPKYSYRLHKVKRPQTVITSQSIDETTSRVSYKSVQMKSDRVGILKSLIDNDKL